jgi:hypothetical protein
VPVHASYIFLSFGLSSAFIHIKYARNLIKMLGFEKTENIKINKSEDILQNNYWNGIVINAMELWYLARKYIYLLRFYLNFQFLYIKSDDGFKGTKIVRLS